MWQSIATGSGTAATIGVIGFVIKNIIDSIREKKTGETTAVSSSVTDAATANAVILDSLKALEKENMRLREKVSHLESDNAKKDKALVALGERLDEAQRQIEAISDELKSHRGEKP